MHNLSPLLPGSAIGAPSAGERLFPSDPIRSSGWKRGRAAPAKQDRSGGDGPLGQSELSDRYPDDYRKRQHLTVSGCPKPPKNADILPV
jgi:hypothetical protein